MKTRSTIFDARVSTAAIYLAYETEVPDGEIRIELKNQLP